MDFLLLIVGLALLVSTGELFIKGATSLARAFGVSPLVIGMTVVAFGTSTPELGVNLVAAFRERSEISYGNIIGSNIANIGLIVGITALYRPLVVHRSVVTREIPFMLVVTLAVVLMLLDGLTGQNATLSRVDGGILLLGLAAFLYMMVRSTKKYRESDAFLQDVAEEAAGEKPLGRAAAITLSLVGLAGILLGSHWTVQGAMGIAEGLGVSEAVIGLTLVAIGTSLPELTTSLLAVRRGHTDLAIGNVVGSNILNIVCVMALTSLVHPIDMPEGGLSDLLVMVGLSVVLLPLAWTHEQKLVRWEGGLLFAAYLSYCIWRAFFAAGAPAP